MIIECGQSRRVRPPRTRIPPSFLDEQRPPQTFRTLIEWNYSELASLGQGSAKKKSVKQSRPFVPKSPSDDPSLIDQLESVLRPPCFFEENAACLFMDDHHLGGEEVKNGLKGSNSVLELQDFIGVASGRGQLNMKSIDGRVQLGDQAVLSD
ncbi:uncharacterized protein MYCFIDRAFT_173447 [Pseudocercospora fijiensis CIRAD86]|uniref:Uncharacterized protein n=1 Tax=Pseudocercospora fijiensis (strain CIRAD86) TaxID=383855 RepID=M3B516_PSEFD|nr:uncharacterized protein MYCFIDRAFT_173447 [Pseudocercospora fijiensis CIRAD86]EME84463.1 hypothetical protein MYCFIDRAFT_173447 [Pseudocercospora fijiensis CIRAD86]